MRGRTYRAGLALGVVTMITMSIVVFASMAVAISPPRNPDSTWQTVGQFVGTKNPTGRVNAIVYGKGASAGMVFVGGNFIEAKPPADEGGAKVTRRGLMAIDAATGDLIGSFSPDFTQDGARAEVRSLEISPDGSKLYVGGKFTHVDGLSRPRLVRLNAVTGAVNGWRPQPYAPVNALEITDDGSVLYAGGLFKKVGPATRNMLAAFDMDNGGSLMSWSPQVTQVTPIYCPGRCWPNVLGLDLSPDESTLYFSGSFAHVNGISRNNVAAVDAVTGTVRPFDPNVLTLGNKPSTNIVSEIVATSNRVYFCGDFWALGVGANRHSSPNLAGVNPTTGRYDTNWIATTDGGTNDCAVVGDALVVGGHFDYAGGEHAGPAPDGTGVYRKHVAAISLSTGAVQSWNPSANSTPGLYAIAASPTKLAIGGDFLTINGDEQAGFAQFSLSADTIAPTVPGKPSGVSNSDSTIDLTWAASTDNQATTITYQIYRDGGGSPIGSVSSASTTTVDYTDTDLAAGTSHTYRVRASDGQNTSNLSPVSNPITVQSGGAPKQVCGTSDGVSLCLRSPSDTLTGDQLITVTVNGNPGFIYAMDFSWGGTAGATKDLLTDFEAPWEFVWRTDQYFDATKWINVRVERPAGTYGEPVSMRLTLENGNDGQVPQNPNDWASLFDPRPRGGGDPEVVAIGDSADGGSRSNDLAASVGASGAEVLLYLGDMYERGTKAEWDYNYGRASFDGPGDGWKWGALAEWTQPTLGNHEAHRSAVYDNYWHGRPDWDTFVYGGVRYINLNSECGQVGGCEVGSPQYQFVQQTLAANNLACVVAFWHRPVVSSVTNNYPMRPIWKLLANNGGDLVLNGHTHAMEIYGPLDGGLNANQADSTMWEIISGSGGHAMTSAAATDPRNVWQKTKTPGALYMTNVGGAGGNAAAIDFAFRNVAGNVISSGGVPGTGTIDCGDDGGGPGIFSDDFAAGLGKWDQVAGVTIDSTRGDHSGPPSARAQATANKRYLRTNLGGTYGSACATASVRVASGTGSISLIRFKTAANVGIGRVYVNMATNELWLRSDVSGAIKRSNTTMSRSQWHDLELCTTSGVSGTYDLSLDGAPILSWNANNGTNPIGMVQLGDSGNQTYTANFDDVEVVEP